MARLQAQDVIRCQYCEDEPAVFHCVPCGDELCPRCKVFHLKSKVPSGHNIVRLSERLHPTNQIKMCEVHSSKAYEACCEDCEVPVCIMCVQDVHRKHVIKKLQDLYEKQKAEAVEELTKLKGQYKSEIIQRIQDFKKIENKIKISHENIREKMKKQVQEFIDHISAILIEALQESEKDERENLMEISRHRVEAERFEQNLDKLIEKFEILTESSHPAELILYRKQYPNTLKRLKFPNKINFTIPSFTIGQINKSNNENQFGKFTKGHISQIRLGDESLQVKHQTWSATRTTSSKKVLERSVKINETKAERKRLYHVSCRDDRSAYISGGGPGIQLIDRSGTRLDNISTDDEPSGLAVMNDGSLIYSDYNNKVIYKVSPYKEKRRLVNTEDHPSGLCSTRSGDILVCMGLDTDVVRVVKYSNSGRKILEFRTNYDRISRFPEPNPSCICENVNDDICVRLGTTGEVVVLNKSGQLRFAYTGLVVNRRRWCGRIDSNGLATDSLGDILIADNGNNAVHLISQNGDFLSYILTEDDGISRPWGISVDKSDILWLVEKDNACVKVFQYLT